MDNPTDCFSNLLFFRILPTLALQARQKYATTETPLIGLISELSLPISLLNEFLYA